MDHLIPETSEIANLFHWYGWAVFESAGLENSLALLFAVSSCNSPNDKGSEEIRSLMELRSKQTLGRLIRDAKTLLGISTELASRFDDALVRRNWLIHDFYACCTPELVNEVRRNKLIVYLVQLRELFSELNVAAENELYDRLKARGFSPEQIETENERFLQRIKEEGSHQS